ncbi:MAG: NAD(P)H-dependent oxidoreductase [Bacteroidia bacterium]|nr:NAD(P)H-dependent oxidoreductase [Bacteroidia bacterium]NNF31277.1 NAD(P)H-dependent oxidoreductase [Flavobacteriaceae bacterium]MBT8275903.1 NAD(P)H-dependent oxidoreductase [Bacteroidia bacterium]NNJ82962.1 NAD(P)H-dependent oxidoreductase [Flavobacteriaceae bacterium]NNK54528.1 NAD(P)H-dependent oxidoreductase [Flavobacteriaceae bacterium]
MNSGIINKLQWRYATKKFDPNKTLSEEKLEILKEAFNLTATSYGLQPLRLIVVSDPEIKEQLVPISMDQQQVKDASHVLIFCTESTVNSKYIKEHFNRVEDIRDTPREILDPFELYLLQSFSEKKPEDIEQWMTKQAYLAMGNLLTVCALEDIDACPMEGFDPEKYDELLQLTQKGLRSVLVMPVGHRADDDMFADLKKVRRGVEKVVISI